MRAATDPFVLSSNWPSSPSFIASFDPAHGGSRPKDATTSYSGRITLFRPGERTFARYDQRDLGWGQIAADGVDVYEIAGLKRTLLRANATEVGRRLKECLARPQPRRPAAAREES